MGTTSEVSKLFMNHLLGQASYTEWRKTDAKLTHSEGLSFVSLPFSVVLQEVSSPSSSRARLLRLSAILDRLRAWSENTSFNPIIHLHEFKRKVKCFLCHTHTHTHDILICIFCFSFLSSTRERERKKIAKKLQYFVLKKVEVEYNNNIYVPGIQFFKIFDSLFILCCFQVSTMTNCSPTNHHLSSFL